jgi:hypothetical protein
MVQALAEIPGQTLSRRCSEGRLGAYVFRVKERGHIAGYELRWYRAHSVLGQTGTLFIIKEEKR